MPAGGDSRFRRHPARIRQPIAQYLPDARHVLDRFHVVRWFTHGLTLVRREIQRREPERRPPTFEPDVFRARFTLAASGRPSHRRPPGVTVVNGQSVTVS